MKRLFLIIFIIFISCRPSPLPQKPSVPDEYIVRSAGPNLYVLIPSLDEMIRIDPINLSYSTILLGSYPITMDASQDGRFLVVLNSRSSNVSIVETQTSSVSNIPVRKGANSISVSRSGKYAIAYLDLTKEGYIPVEGVLNLNEISIIDTDSKISQPLTLGFDPSIAGFTPSETRAVVLSRSQAAIIDTSPPFRTITVPLVPEPSQWVTPTRLVITETKAFVSIKESGDIYAIDLVSPSVNIVTVDGAPYCVELVCNGTYLLVGTEGSSVVSLIDTSDLWIYTVDLVEIYDSAVISRPGGISLFYKKGKDKIAVVDNIARIFLTYSLLRGVEGAGIADDENSAILIHTSGGIETYLQYSISIIDFDRRTSHPISLQSMPVDFLIYNPELAFVTLKEAGGVAVVDMKEKTASWLKLLPVPEKIGSLSSLDMVYIIHDQPLGRVSFIDTGTMKVKTTDGIFTNKIYDR